MLGRLAPSAINVDTPHGRRICLVISTVVLAIGVLFWPASPASAAPDEKCSYTEWTTQGNIRTCIDKLDPVASQLNDCMGVPTPDGPDSGFGGWFASNPHVKGIKGYYSTYGYSGYSYPIYNPDCVTGNSPLPTGADTTTTIANGELMVANGIVGAANGLRERSYDPGQMWGWSNTLVTKATKAVYQKVFSVFGVITVAVVGLYLVWRSRQADLSDALTTAGWAVLVMVVVTAVAAWPLHSAHLADSTLLSSLGLIHSAVGPQQHSVPISECVYARPNQPGGAKPDPSLCKDRRPAAVLASDTATETILYDSWLRGTLGSATSTTAKEFGPALYEASALSWDDTRRIQAAENPKHGKPNPNVRKSIYAKKAEDFRRIANEIRTQDPNAFNYLQGKNGSARMGAGLISMVSALAFGFFDIAASLLIMLGFLIFRWAVVAVPIIGTVALLRPASAGFKRLVNIVIAAIFNIIIFGAGASIYLFAVDLIMNTATLPGWLQITLVWLCGVVGWLLLRPYRRITQLGGKSPMGEIANIGSWHKRFFGDLKGVALGAAGAAAFGDIEAQDGDEPKRRRAEQTKDAPTPVTPGRQETSGQPIVSDPAPDEAQASSSSGQSTPERPAPPRTPAPAGSTTRGSGCQPPAATPTAATSTTNSPTTWAARTDSTPTWRRPARRSGPVSDHRPDLDLGGPWFPSTPAAIEPVPAASFAGDLRGQRVVVGKAGFGWRYDLRADDPVEERGLPMVPVLAEQDWYRAERDQVDVFAPLVPVEHVWVEQVQDTAASAPAEGPPNMLQRLVTLDAPPVRPATPARDVPALTGRRLVMSAPDKNRRDVRALSEPYQRPDGDICVRIAEEADWYRWATDGIPPPGVTAGIHLLWVEA